jgi:methylated-DNA-[protein]-cysteine S-methyltransferase
MAGIPIKKFKAIKSFDANRDLFEEADHIQSGAASDETGVHAGLYFVGNELQLMQDQTPQAAQTVFRQIRAELSEYFSGKRRVFNTPLAFKGTDFQKKIWQALLTIPYGEFVSYGDIAHAAGLTAGHSRAVGAAVGRNPISIVVPCHRVLSSVGTLTGYSGGLERKFALLELEGFLLRQP